MLYAVQGVASSKGCG